tara:strand:- start:556 stop:774 length:219 start_codon:yes stop_codon:yes gene_type:complete
MNHLNEETIMEVVADTLNSGKLEEYDTTEQMEIIEIITESIRLYHAKELDSFLEGLHNEYTWLKTKDKLSDL